MKYRKCGRRRNVHLLRKQLVTSRLGSSVGIVTDFGLDGPGSKLGGDEIFPTCPDRPWGPPSLLQNGYRIFHRGKVRPGRAADHSPPSSAAVMEEYSYNSTHPVGHTGPITGSLYLFSCLQNLVINVKKIINLCSSERRLIYFWVWSELPRKWVNSISY